MSDPNTPTLPPPQPTAILRGHQSQIHTLSFYASNTRLLSGDGDGFVISWDVATKRPVAGWRAHSKAILAAASWTSYLTNPLSSHPSDLIITQGRDGRLAVWRLDAATERMMHSYVPVSQLQQHVGTAKPAMFAEVAIGSTGFCALAACEAPADMSFAFEGLSLGGDSDDEGDGKRGGGAKRRRDEGVGWAPKPLLVAAPSPARDEDVALTYLPSGKRKSTVKAPGGKNLGMVMAVLLKAKDVGDEGNGDGADGRISMAALSLAIAYESGTVLLFRHAAETDAWEVVYRARPHSQPILSLALHPAGRVFLSSGADAVLARHPFANKDLLAASGGDRPLKVVKTGHAGMQSLTVRSDGKIFAAGGWDGRVRVYSAKTMKEMAVMKGGSGSGKSGSCYAVAWADVGKEGEDRGSQRPLGRDTQEKRYGNIVLRLDRVNKRYKLKIDLDEEEPAVPSASEEEALWIRINERVAETKKTDPDTLHRVLDDFEEWAGTHEDECYTDRRAATELGLLPPEESHAQMLLTLLESRKTIKAEDDNTDGSRKDDSGAEILVPATPVKSRAMLRYEDKIKSTHWLATGSKDGTIALWNVF